MSQSCPNLQSAALNRLTYDAMCTQVLADGRLTPERRAELEKVREQMGLTQEASDKIISGIANKRIGSSLQV